MSILGTLGRGIIPTGFAYMDYNYAREEGRGKVSSMVSAAGEFALGELLGAWYIPVALGRELPSMVSGAVGSMAQKQRLMGQKSINTPFNSSTFIDSKGSATMRQQAMASISRDKMLRQQLTLGQEAKYR